MLEIRVQSSPVFYIVRNMLFNDSVHTVLRSYLQVCLLFKLSGLWEVEQVAAGATLGAYYANIVHNEFFK